MTLNRAAIVAASILAISSSTLGCGKKSDAGGGPSAQSSAAKPPTATATATTAAATKGDPEPAITPGPRKPFESLVFRNTGQVNKSGWPKFDLYNQSDKKVKYAAIIAYAYSDSGKLVTRTDTPLSWNDNSGVEPGKKAAFSVEIDSWGKAPVGAGATKFELCYEGIKFDDDKIITDNKLCPATRPVGGVK